MSTYAVNATAWHFWVFDRGQNPITHLSFFFFSYAHNIVPKILTDLVYLLPCDASRAVAGTRVTTTTLAQRRGSSTQCTAGVQWLLVLGLLLSWMSLGSSSLRRCCWMRIRVKRTASTASTW
jgi:hypothetical protein